MKEPIDWLAFKNEISKKDNSFTSQIVIQMEFEENYVLEDKAIILFDELSFSKDTINANSPLIGVKIESKKI